METIKRKIPSRSSSQDTPARIREAAEQLFADLGMDAVSLRQIATAASAGNNNTVQYYFGDKEGLVRSIFESRLPAIDARRAELFGKLSANEVDDPASLLEVLLKPFADFVDSQGKHRWAAFLLAVDNAPTMMAIRVGVETQAPVTAMVYGRLVNALGPWPIAVARYRLNLAFRTFFRGLVSIDREFGGQSQALRLMLVQDYLAISKAIICEPAAKVMVEAMSDG